MTSRRSLERGHAWHRTYFDERFISLYAPLLPEEQTRAEVAAVMEILGLPVGSQVLDLACGWGRHARELARAGLRVTALDGSEALLRHGADRGLDGVRWICADARELPLRPRFDGVLSLFSSLGYFQEDEEDVRVLRGAGRVLHPGGRLLVETMHRDQIAREYAERDWWEGAAREEVRVEREFDPVAGISHERLLWRAPDGTSGEKRHSIRIRSATEWEALLLASGLEPLAWYGSWEMDPFTTSSERLIVVAAAG